MSHVKRILFPENEDVKKDNNKRVKINENDDYNYVKLVTAEEVSIFDHITITKRVNAGARVEKLLQKHRRTPQRLRVTFSDHTHIDFLVKSVKECVEALMNLTKDTTYPKVAGDDLISDLYDSTYMRLNGENLEVCAYGEADCIGEYTIGAQSDMIPHIVNASYVIEGDEVLSMFYFDCANEPLIDRKELLFMGLELYIVSHAGIFKIFDVKTKTLIALFENHDIEYIRAVYQ